MAQHTDTGSAAEAGARAQWELRERVKELTCLYGISQVAARPGVSRDAMMRAVLGLLPPGWQYPEVTQARITLDGTCWETPGFGVEQEVQSAEVAVRGEGRGSVEVTYADARPKADEGPFLKEERHLIDAVAREIGFVIERREAEEEKSSLQEQLMHADRLATIGQMAAVMAHELNEPLSNILGFAQLAAKTPDLPGAAGRDLGKIVNASLYAREVIRKLLDFARQTPPRDTRVNVSSVVEEGLRFFGARCAKAGIDLVRSLSPELPEIVADPIQLSQVLVNLVVNAVQAMPEGGRLEVRTAADAENVFLVVEDSGVGMSPDTVRKAFEPFFTTKDPGWGTGLGLSVARGIVASHGGAITVDSDVGRGTRFEVRLPIRRAGQGREGA